MAARKSFKGSLTIRGYEKEEMMSDNQIAIMRAMVYETQGTGYSPDELLFGHRTLIGFTKLDHKTISKELKGLREQELVYYYRGGMNEDGEVCGAGNGLTPKGFEEIKKHLNNDEKEELGYE